MFAARLALGKRVGPDRGRWWRDLGRGFWVYAERLEGTAAPERTRRREIRKSRPDRPS
jgi:hypothetical protein